MVDLLEAVLDLLEAVLSLMCRESGSELILCLFHLKLLLGIETIYEQRAG